MMNHDERSLRKAHEMVEQLKQRGVNQVRILAVDFDGTITRTTQFPKIGAIRPLAIQVLRAFQKEGGKVLLFTCRAGDDLAKALDVLKQAGFQPDFVNEQTVPLYDEPQGTIEYRKPYYDLLIDDRALNCPVDWFVIGLVLSELLPTKTQIAMSEVNV